MKEKLTRLLPFLFVVISLLSVYTGARLIASPLQLVRPLIVLWGVLLLFYPLCKRLTGDKDWGNLLLTVFVIGLCFTRSNFIKVGAFSILLVGAISLSLWLLKRKIRIQDISFSLSLFALAFVIFQLGSLLVILKPIPASYYQNMAERANEPAIPITDPVLVKPDIYYIILDGYPRLDVLNEIYDYDNSEFIDSLKDLGFVIPENSHSNYSRTAISVSTTLDMQYWNSISPGMEKAVYWWLVEPVMDHNRLRATLETLGYKYVAIASDWGITNNTSAEIYLSPYPLVLSDFENYFLSSTPLKLIYTPFQSIAPIVTNDVHREYINYNLAALKNAPTIPGPKFTFSHIILPHPPFVFDAEGNPIDSGGGFTFDSPDSASFAKAEYKENYVGQVEFINRQIRQVIQALLEKSQIPPVIIIQADHGSALYVNFKDLQGSCMKERFSIFAAYYLPGQSKDVIPQDISAVNIFRIVLNKYFNAGLVLLDNRSYFMNGFYLYDNQDVSDRVNDPCFR